LFQLTVQGQDCIDRKSIGRESALYNVVIGIMKEEFSEVVTALMKIPQGKENIEKQIASRLEIELSDLCSDRHPSVLRKTGSKELSKLTMESINDELKIRSPLTHRLLRAMCITRKTRQSHQRGEREIPLSKIVSPACVILHARSKNMLAWSLKNSLALQYGGCSNMVSVGGESTERSET